MIITSLVGQQSHPPRRWARWGCWPLRSRWRRASNVVIGSLGEAVDASACSASMNFVKNQCAEVCSFFYA